MTKEDFISSVEPSFIARMMADYVEYYISHNRDYPQSFSYYIESLPGEAVEITFSSEEMWDYIDCYHPGAFSGVQPLYV